jgi:hypothetical protein
MRRREFITLFGGTSVAWPLVALAQQATIPVIGFLGSDSPELYTDRLRAFRRGLKDAGYIESENLAIEYRWANGNDTCSTSAQGGHHFNSDSFLYSGRSSRTRTCRKLESTWRKHHWHYSPDFRGWKKMAAALAGDCAVSDRICCAYQPD